jgi:NAD(P)-dependent dehydrogenase (short-subunit alcohol dehydrogenase family)
MSTTHDFIGKVAFVTGAAGGIGRATAIAFAQAGAYVALVDIDQAGCEESAKAVQDAGGRALSLRCDLTVESEVESALAQTVKTFGGLDFAFNNAGKYQNVAAAADISDQEWRRIIDVNVTGTFLCMRSQIPLMQKRGGGAIVNTSSGAGIMGIKGAAAYSAAKHAVIGLTRSAALDYAETGVRINAVCPGIVHTSMAVEVSGGTAEGLARMAAEEPIGRLGRPEEIASAVLWLCSSTAGFTIGHALVVDGGHTIGAITSQGDKLARAISAAVIK